MRPQPSGSFKPPTFAEIRDQIETLAIAERFFESCVLFALHRLGVFALLAAGPKALTELRQAIPADADDLSAALDAAVALGILTKSDDRYAAGARLTRCLGRPESSSYLGEWLDFLYAMVPPMLHLDDVVRTGTSSDTVLDETGGNAEPARRMTAALEAYARTRGVEMVHRIDLAGARSLLDVGCGPGTYALALLERWPELHVTMLDRERPIAAARRHAAARGLLDRVDLVAADVLEWQPSRHFDAILISNTLHAIGAEQSRRLLRRCASFLAANGKLMVQAQFLDSHRAAPRWSVLVNLITRVLTPHGRNHTVEETVQWMAEAGFVAIEHIRFSAWNVNSVLMGRRPPA